MAQVKERRIMVSVYLEPSQLADLRALVKHTDVLMAEYLREAVDDLLKKHARELKKAKA